VGSPRRRVGDAGTATGAGSQTLGASRYNFVYPKPAPNAKIRSRATAIAVLAAEESPVAGERRQRCGGSAVLDPAVEEWAVEERPQTGVHGVEAAFARIAGGGRCRGQRRRREKGGGCPDREPRPAGRRAEEPATGAQSAADGAPAVCAPPTTGLPQFCRTSVRFALQAPHPKHRCSSGSRVAGFQGPMVLTAAGAELHAGPHSLCRTLRRKP